MKKLIPSFFVCLFLSVWAYGQIEVEWGSYYGPESNVPIKAQEDPEGNIYLSSVIYGSNSEMEDYLNEFITENAYYEFDGNFPLYNSLLLKLSPDGEILWGTYIPGDISDMSLSPNGQSLYLTGGVIPNINQDLIASEQALFPNPFEFGEDTQSILHSFVLKFDASNGQRVWGTFLPSTTAISVDENETVYVGGRTYIPNVFSEESPPIRDFIYDYSEGGNLHPNIYILKLNSQGQLLWNTFYGKGVVSNITANYKELYVAGGGRNTPDYYASEDAYLSGYNDGMFLSKFDIEGNRMWSTYYGEDSGLANYISTLKITADDKIIVAGSTTSASHIATEGTYRQELSADIDYFLAQFDSMGNPEWGTYFGGEEDNTFSYDINRNILAITDDYIFVSGATKSSIGIATEDGLNTTIANPYNHDSFVNIFDHSGNRLWGSYYGGTRSEVRAGVIADPAQDYFLLYGQTNSFDGIATSNGAFPEINMNPSENHPGLLNGFIAKFVLNDYLGLNTLEPETIQLYLNPSPGKFNLEGEVLGKAKHRLQLFDLQGRLVIDRVLGLYEQQHFDFSGFLNSGTYLMKIKSENAETQQNFKLIVK